MLGPGPGVVYVGHPRGRIGGQTGLERAGLAVLVAGAGVAMRDRVAAVPPERDEAPVALAVRVVGREDPVVPRDDDGRVLGAAQGAELVGGQGVGDGGPPAADSVIGLPYLSCQE